MLGVSLDGFPGGESPEEVRASLTEEFGEISDEDFEDFMGGFSDLDGMSDEEAQEALDMMFGEGAGLSEYYQAFLEYKYNPEGDEEYDFDNEDYEFDDADYDYDGEMYDYDGFNYNETDFYGYNETDAYGYNETEAYDYNEDEAYNYNDDEGITTA